ncbi:hypothetical protein [Aeromicrobium wangtongii]|uniref:Tetracyclin repressor-like C-terminal domain-containing protein n=1 Tax=Aeromicrobium wangtongii TaxID=2969247 RepID=A0ABY5M9R9_9ACTN|nr:hypothetical protein [Aeromicrobium wangtongii]MCD9196682.1 hypothetical protein [Aeromicrobium wangtongii]MCL3817608.1 hypothetical protein [Aeromicrobium wangtongii]UUP14192.1 hypothetical protein NQV15_02440 [Aeromicrobium wangtongii]
MESAWDQLLELIDHLAADPTTPVDHDTEQTFARLGAEAIRDRHIDTELRADDIARWLCGLVAGYRTVRATHPEVDPDTDLADLRRIITRWLHPARPR